MRITHGDIGELMTDLRGWVERKRHPESQFVRTGYRGAIKLAIYNYHKDENLERSQRYLDDVMNRLNLKNGQRRADAEQTLSGYTDWWGGSRVVTVQTRLRISLELDDDVTLGGEVSRIDLGVDTVEYRGMLLGIQDSGWARQLRMPVLQLAIASRLERDPTEVVVGIQELDGTGLQVTQYSPKSIHEALEEVRSLAQQARRLLERP